MARKWTPDELALLKANAALGIARLRKVLPDRHDTAIYQQSYRQGVRIADSRHGSDTRWRGKLPIPRHTSPQVRRLIEEANRQHTLLSELSAAAGLLPSTVSSWRYRTKPIIDNIEAAYNVLGYTLRPVPMREEP